MPRIDTIHRLDPPSLPLQPIEPIRPTPKGLGSVPSTLSSHPDATLHPLLYAIRTATLVENIAGRTAELSEEEMGYIQTAIVESRNTHERLSREVYLADQRRSRIHAWEPIVSVGGASFTLLTAAASGNTPAAALLATSSALSLGQYTARQFGYLSPTWDRALSSAALVTGVAGTYLNGAQLPPLGSWLHIAHSVSSAGTQVAVTLSNREVQNLQADLTLTSGKVTDGEHRLDEETTRAQEVLALAQRTAETARQQLDSGV